MARLENQDPIPFQSVQGIFNLTMQKQPSKILFLKTIRLFTSEIFLPNI